MKNRKIEDIEQKGWDEISSEYIFEMINNDDFKLLSPYNDKDITEALGDGQNGDNLIGFYNQKFFDGELCPSIGIKPYWARLKPGQYDSMMNFYKTLDNNLIIELQL